MKFQTVARCIGLELLFLFNLHSGEPTNPLSKQDEIAFEDIPWSERSWIPRVWPKEKVEALRKSYWTYGTENEGHNWGGAAPNLIQLGDEKVIDDFIKGGDATSVSWTRDPKVIPKLAPMMLSDEMLQTHYGPRAVAAEPIRAILNLLETTPEFSINVKEWANEGAHAISAEQVTGFAVMRQWWRQNGHWFATGEYEKVQPGAHFPADFPNPNAIPEPVPSPVEATTNHAEAPPPTTPAIVSLPPSVHRESTSFWALLGGAAAALLGLGAIVWRTRLRKSR